MDDALRQMLVERLFQGGAGGQDPRREMLRAMLERSAAPAGPSLEDRLDEAQGQNAALRAALRESAALIAYVGRTFGACQACWGTRSDCPVCHGRGRPGTFPLDAQEALGWIEPALDRLGLVARPAGPSLNARPGRPPSQREEKTDA
jgi:hypothetical protein